MPKFIGRSSAKNATPENSLPKEQIEEIKVKRSKVLDFGAITVKHLAKELEDSITTSTPIFLWSKYRLNEKIELDNEKLILIKDKIKSLKDINTELLDLEANLIFNEDYLKHLVDKKIALANLHLEWAIEDCKTNIQYLKTNSVLTKNKEKHDKIDLDSKRINLRKLKAEAARIEEGNELLKILKSKINVDNLPTIYTTYLLSLFFNNDGSQVSDLEIKEQMKALMVKRADIDIEKGMAEVDSLMADNDMKKLKNKLAKKDAGL